MKCVAAVVCLTLLSCCQTDIQSKPAKKERVTDTMVPDEVLAARTGKFYDVLLTNDPGFCNPDSIVEGDCNSGYLYFTPKGHVIFHYLCVGATEEEYCIGKASLNGQGMRIFFDQSYTYSVSDDIIGPTLKELNNGKMEQDTFSLQLNPLKCTGKYGYIVRQDDKRFDHYLVQESKSDGISDYATDQLQKIKALKQF